MKTSGNTILMTGGGSGIGEALAHRFHDRGDTVIIAGRRREALERRRKGASAFMSSRSTSRMRRRSTPSPNRSLLTSPR